MLAGYVLGPVTGDHWFVYIADKCDRPDYTATDRTVRSMENMNALIEYIVCVPLKGVVRVQFHCFHQNSELANHRLAGVLLPSDQHDDVRHAS